MGNFRDITGQKFGKLTVISFSRDVKSGNRYRKYWNCICECGNHKEVRLDSLTSGNVKSCGCLHEEVSYKNLTPGSPKYDVIDKGNYTLYVCNTKHNKGTYTFAVS